MQKSVADKIAEYPVYSTWGRDCRIYAQELFENYVKSMQPGKKVTDADLLNGSKNWLYYSYCGRALRLKSTICERLCSPKVANWFKHGRQKPPFCDSWFTVQTCVLKRAARMVRSI